MDWTWDLTVLYRDFDDPRIEKDFEEIRSECVLAIEAASCIKVLLEEGI